MTNSMPKKTKKVKSIRFQTLNDHKKTYFGSINGEKFSATFINFLQKGNIQVVISGAKKVPKL